jgi:two-component system chemotaxis response regulator CheB
VGKNHPQYEEMAKELVDTVKLMSEVKVLTRRPSLRKKKAICGVLRDAAKRPSIEVLAIGASTGGPQVLQTILSQLPEELRVPILIVQHIAPGFTRGLVDWLNTSSAVPIYLAAHHERFAAGYAYIAPQELQMGVNKRGQIILGEGPREHGHRPSVSYLFRSVADTFGHGAAGVLLTGMGKDGAGELKLMKEKGAVTIVQDRETCVVDGMPGEAIGLGAADHELSPDEIASFLSRLVTKGRTEQRDAQPTNLIA